MAALLFLSKHRKNTFLPHGCINNLCVPRTLLFPVKILIQIFEKKRIIPSYKISKCLGLMMQRAWLNKIPYVVLVE